MEIQKYEKMVKLDLHDDERKWITGLAEKVLESCSVLDSIDTDGVELAVPNGQNCLREDVSVKAITRDELLANAPEQYDGYFQIPKAVV